MEIAETVASWRLDPDERERLYASQIEARHRERASRFALERIADARGDVDAYIDLHSSDERDVPKVAAAIARRLLDAGRRGEALQALDKVDLAKATWLPDECEDARSDALEVLGRSGDAQDFRWERFSTTLSARHLRAWLRKLPDFEDFGGEQRALAHCASFPNVRRAAGFFMAAKPGSGSRACRALFDGHGVMITREMGGP